MIRSSRFAMVAVTTAAMIALAAPSAWAGSPHFVGAPTLSRSGDTLTVSAKEAGLGDEAQINVTLSATALCINGGGKHPSATNKESLASNAVVPVQNGKADYTLSVTASFSPPCSPPMTVEFTDVKLADTTNNLTVSFPGTF